MRFEYCISRGPGTLVTSGSTESRAEATEVFDEYVKDTTANATFKKGGEIQHYQKENWSMTTMPVGFAG